MAEKKYSPSDQQKMTRDFLADCRAKGMDFQEMKPLVSGQPKDVIDTLKKNLSSVKDQSQIQTEQNREQAKKINQPKEIEN